MLIRFDRQKPTARPQGPILVQVLLAQLLLDQLAAPAQQHGHLKANAKVVELQDRWEVGQRHGR